MAYIRARLTGLPVSGRIFHLKILIVLHENVCQKQDNNWISRWGPINWIATSLDLTTIYFLLDYYVIHHICYEIRESLDHLKTAIQHSIRRMDTSPLKNICKLCMIKLTGLCIGK